MPPLSKIWTQTGVVGVDYRSTSSCSYRPGCAQRRINISLFCVSVWSKAVSRLGLWSQKEGTTCAEIHSSKGAGRGSVADVLGTPSIHALSSRRVSDGFSDRCFSMRAILAIPGEGLSDPDACWMDPPTSLSTGRWTPSSTCLGGLDKSRLKWRLTFTHLVVEWGHFKWSH